MTKRVTICIDVPDDVDTSSESASLRAAINHLYVAVLEDIFQLDTTKFNWDVTVDQVNDEVSHDETD